MKEQSKLVCCLIYYPSLAEIDEQLFDKYSLDEQERNFIRTKVKEMN